MSNEEWEPFLEIFDEITIFSRLDRKNHSEQGYVLDHPRIKLVPIPYYEGLFEFLQRLGELRRFIRKHFVDPTAYYGLWAPNILGPYIVRKVRRMQAPLLVRVIGDAVAVARAIVPEPFRRLAMWTVGRRARQTIVEADAIVYVTLSSLQSIYPPPPGALTLARTNLRFTDEMKKVPKKEYTDVETVGPFSLIAVGSQEQNYKGHDLLLTAVAELRKQNRPVKLTLVGDGRFHDALVAQSKELDLTDITFIRRLGTNVEVAKEVIRHDMFVMPSRTEGMPKALLEAMFVGVFSLGSDVGGIPELLDPDCIFDSNSSQGIVDAVSRFIDNPGKMRGQLDRQRDVVEMIRTQHSGPDVMREFLTEWVATRERAN